MVWELWLVSIRLDILMASMYFVRMAVMSVVMMVAMSVAMTVVM